MNPEKCSDKDCARPATGGRGMCHKHYMRWYAVQGSDEPCSVDGCERRCYGKSGLCALHYRRTRKMGDVGPAEAVYVRNGPVETRFWSKVANGDVQPHRPELGPCWIWQRGKFPEGYGLFVLDGVNQSAHRVAYEMLVGPIPAGLTLDHLCHTGHPTCLGGRTCPHRACVNPDHLEPVSMSENIARGLSAGAVGARSNICIHGHDLTDPANLKPPRKNGKVRRECRQCAKDARARRYVRLGR